MPHSPRQTTDINLYTEPPPDKLKKHVYDNQVHTSNIRNQRNHADDNDPSADHIVPHDIPNEIDSASIHSGPYQNPWLTAYSESDTSSYYEMTDGELFSRQQMKKRSYTKVAVMCAVVVALAILAPLGVGGYVLFLRPSAQHGENWDTWGTWSHCSSSCGNGTRTRLRSCSAGDLAICGENSEEIEDCEISCNGSWGSWQEWSQCSHSCDNGSIFRTRNCDNPSPHGNGLDCEGQENETQLCILMACAINGNWSEWQPWSECSLSCGEGVKTRNRSCDNPSPEHNGTDCSGSSLDIINCSLTECPINGNWNEWQPWGECSRSCGEGIQIRNRTCDNPVPEHNGTDCSGSSLDIINCSLTECPINGNWNEWQPWGECSRSCGEGIQIRNRTCDNPVPEHNGTDCSGKFTDLIICPLAECPIDGNWSEWQPWGECSKTCDNGTRRRNRSCDNPPPQHNGQDCVGSRTENEHCNNQTCPIGIWNTWNEWTNCSVSCGEGTSNRVRSCDNSSGGECVGSATETRRCEADLKCWDSWGPWGTCSTTCGSGLRTRNRTCDGSYTGEECGVKFPTFREGKDCSNEVCTVDQTNTSYYRHFCEDKVSDCVYKHPNRCELYVVCDNSKKVERFCNVC